MTIDEAAKRLRDAYLDRDKWPNRFDARDKGALEILLDAVNPLTRSAACKEFEPSLNNSCDFCGRPKAEHGHT